MVMCADPRILLVFSYGVETSRGTTNFGNALYDICGSIAGQFIQTLPALLVSGRW